MGTVRSRLSGEISVGLDRPCPPSFGEPKRARFVRHMRHSDEVRNWRLNLLTSNSVRAASVFQEMSAFSIDFEKWEKCPWLM